jgi:ssDNA-binding replication factor A large subunit
MSEDPIYCFNGGECIYKNCPRFNQQLDTCAFVIIGLRQGTAPVAQTSLTAFPKLEQGKFLQEITGTLLDDPVQREVNTTRGPTNVTSFRITDGRKEVRVSLWEDLSDEALKFNAGSNITLTRMSIKDPYDGTDQISSTRKTEIV